VDLGPRYAAWQVAQGLPLPPTEVSPLGQPGDPVPDWSLAAGRPIRTTQGHPHIQITSPRSGLRLVRDPESPPADSIGLAAAVEPPVAQLVWYVDGHPFRVADRPHTARWSLQPGVHEIQARLPFSKDASASVRITVD
jgi:penicillin-binding protein 1C